MTLSLPRLKNGNRLRDFALLAITLFLLFHEGVPMARALVNGDVAPAATPMGSVFTFQGKLVQNGAAVSGQRDFRFQLYDSAAGGNPIGPAMPVNVLTVTNGLFSLPLDAGAVFNGEKRWLEVQVKSGSNFETVGRQELTATPYDGQPHQVAVATNGHLFIAPAPVQTGAAIDYLTGHELDTHLATRLQTSITSPGDTSAIGSTFCYDSLCTGNWSSNGGTVGGPAIGLLAPGDGVLTCRNDDYARLEFGDTELVFAQNRMGVGEMIEGTCEQATRRNVAAGEPIGYAGNWTITATRRDGTPLSVAVSRDGTIYIEVPPPTIGCPCRPTT